LDSTELTSEDWEHFIFVYDYWDLPIEGIVFYHGKPHWFICPWNDEIDSHANFYYLWPLPSELLPLEEEFYRLSRTKRAEIADGTYKRADELTKLLRQQDPDYSNAIEVTFELRRPEPFDRHALDHAAHVREIRFLDTL